MNYKISFLLLTMVPSTLFQQDSSWFDMDSAGEWEVSNKFMRTNPYYATTRHISRQMDMYGPAQHVGQINRGDFRNPELNMPKDQAYGYNSDFNPQDSPGKCQWVIATQPDVDLGFAKCPGEKFCLQNGLEVQSDSSLVVETFIKNPCSPNPCWKHKIQKCEVHDNYKARCVPRRGNYEMVMRWGWSDGQDSSQDLNLFTSVFARSDPYDSYDNYDTDYVDEIEVDDNDFFGVVPGTDYNYDTFTDAYSTDYGMERLLFTTSSDGKKYTSYNYMVAAYHGWSFLDYSDADLDVIYDGRVVQTVTVPRFDGTDYGDPDTASKQVYVFGCFRNSPNGYYLDTTKRGFVVYEDSNEYYQFCDFDRCTT